MVTAERPSECQVIEKGLPGPGLVAHVITSKYVDHQPLYRLEGMLARHGVTIARSTMCGWMKAAADLVTPLVAVMAQRVRGSKVIHTDDTPVPVQAPGQNKTKTGRLWVYLGDSRNPYIVYDYTPNRSRDGPTSWLKGYLQADAFGGYDGIYATQEIIEVACWAHTRRKFYDARKSDPARAHEALALIRLLYDVERHAKEMDTPQRMALRQEQSVPLLDRFREWMDQRRDAVLPKSPMGAAIGYALNQWKALVRYATDASGPTWRSTKTPPSAPSARWWWDAITICSLAPTRAAAPRPTSTALWPAPSVTACIRSSTSVMFWPRSAPPRSPNSKPSPPSDSRTAPMSGQAWDYPRGYEFECELIRERTMAGLASARARGRKGGWRHSQSKAQVGWAPRLPRVQ